MNYPHDTISINGRDVCIAAILDKLTVPLDAFEQTTFDFICRWYSTNDIFELQTSGSTGLPKTITVRRTQMIASATLTATALDLHSNHTALICLDTRYVAGQMMLVRCFVVGMKILAVTPSANPFSVGKSVDFVALVPYQIYAILDSPQNEIFNNIHSVIIGGAPLDPTAEQRLKLYKAAFYATYGMTETLSHVALRKLNGHDASQFFKALPGIKIDQDERDCLVLDVPYLGERIVTNDIVEILGQHAFRWLGRFDHVINTGGVKVIPEVIEETIATVFEKLSPTTRYFIAGLPHRKLGEQVVLFVEGKKFSVNEEGFLAERLRKELPAYAIPREVICVEVFEMTKTNKINRLKTIQNIDKTLQKFTLKK